MCIKVLLDRSVAQEGVICWFRKCQEIENKEWDQYKKVVRTLNKEVTAITEKLKEESCLQEKAQKAKES